MKTNKTFAYGIFAVIIALAFITCDNGNNDTHTHDYGTEWKSNATQHWRECSCGEKTDVANHSGDPCDICGYASGTQNPDPCECNGNAEDCDCEDCDCEICEEETPSVNEPVIASYGATPATITVPAENSVQLKCTATSADGSAVKSIQWTVEQKPALANPTIENAQTDTATVNDIDVAGTYKFKLVVTGNNDVTKTEYVTVIAGLDYEVEFGAYTSGGNTINFSPSATLPKGVTYTVTDNLDNIYETTFNIGINDGPYSYDTYTFTQVFKIGTTEIGRQVIKVDVTTSFRVLQDANGNTLNPQAIPSVTLKWPADSLAAHAQAAPTHTLAHDLTITLNGTGSTGNISAYAWECASYAANQGTVSAAYTKAQVDALITNANTATATVAPRKAGTYVFKLTVTGDEGESDTDTVAVVVESAGTVQKDVEVSFPNLAQGSSTLNFSPTYAPSIAGDGFENGDVVYYVTNDKTDARIDSTSNFEIAGNSFSAGEITFTQIFEYKDGTEIIRRIVSAIVNPVGIFISVSSPVPPIDLHLEKTVTEL